jgi:hypothetical protein
MAELTIAIATGPSGGLSLKREMRLVKPALLYADRVTLISPVAALLRATVDFGSSVDLTLSLFRELRSSLDPAAAEAFAHYEHLRSKRRPTRDEIRAMYQYRHLLGEASAELHAKSRELLNESGADELIPAIDAGVVTIDPVIREGDSATALVPGIQRAAGVEPDYDSLIADSFLQRLRDLLVDAYAYPLFDEQVGDIVRSHVSEGLFEVGAMSLRHGRQASTAAQLMEKLPSFPAASLAEVLDIREELRGPLTRFRAAVAEMERLLQSAAHEQDFAAEVEDLYREKVAPALQEIAELVEQNSYLHQLMRAVAANPKSALTAVRTMGVAGAAGIPDLAAAALGPAIPLGEAAVRASLASREGHREIEGHHLFFLYKTEELLSRVSSVGPV